MSWYEVDTKLLPVKGIYFTFLAVLTLFPASNCHLLQTYDNPWWTDDLRHNVFYKCKTFLSTIANKLVFTITAMGDLVPFLLVYMKQLGLSSTETGIIYGVMPFISFLVRPLIGAVADKTRKHKLSLITCILFTGVCHCLLLFVPSQTCDLQNRRQTQNQLELCQGEESVHIFCDEHELYHQVNHTYTTCQSVLDTIHFYQQDGGALLDVLHELCTNLSQQEAKLKGWNLCCYRNNRCDMLFFNISAHNLTMTLDQYHESINIDQSSNYSICIDLDQHVNLNASICQHLCNGEQNSSTECLAQGDLNTTFWLTFLIFLFCNVFYSPVLSLLDAIAYDILRDRRRDWGKQRMWGTVGVGMFAVASSFAMESFSKSGSGVNYNMSFYIFFALTIASCIIAYFLGISESIRCSRMLTSIGMLLKYPKIVIFLCLVTCFGIMNAVIQIFLFWYLQERGSTQITLGLCVLANCLPEMGAFFCSGIIINRIGHVKCLYLATLGYAVRFFGYSFVTNPWYVLFIEPLHCLTYGLMYSAATSYASIIAPEGMSATIQGLIGGLYMGFGKGIGSVVTGKLFDTSTGLGPIWTFRFYGIFALTVLAVYAMTNIVLFRDEIDSDLSMDVTTSQKDHNQSTPREQLLEPVHVIDVNNEHEQNKQS